MSGFVAGGNGSDAALLELRNGTIGEVTIDLLRQLARQYTRSAQSNFPAPEGFTSWSNDAVDNLIADMFARPDAKNPGEVHKFVLDCYLRATDGQSLERLLLTAIGNFLKDQAKSTSRGKLRRRMTNLLGSDPRFCSFPGDRWALATGPIDVWQGDWDCLEQAAFRIRGLQISRLNHAGPTAKGPAEALLKISEAVLAEAGGAVRTEDIARVLQSRFPLLQEPDVASLDGISDPAVASSEFEESSVTNARAQQVFTELTPQERALLPVLVEPDRWQESLGVGPKVARALGDLLIQKLRLATIDDHDCDAVVLELLDLCVENSASR